MKSSSNQPQLPNGKGQINGQANPVRGALNNTPNRPLTHNGNGNGNGQMNGNGHNGNGHANGNGHNGNGHANGNGNGGGPGGVTLTSNGDSGGAPPQFSDYVPQSFDKPVILRQSPVWARWIAISIMGVTVASVLSAFIFKVDENIGAQGKLEPLSAVQVVQAPLGGVVDEILVEEGEMVERGQVVATLDETSTEAQIESARERLQALREENAYYSAQQAGIDADAPEGISPALIQRSSDRLGLIESNRLYRAQINGDSSGLLPSQLAQFSAAQSDKNNEQSINRDRAGELREQLDQAQVQLVNARNDLETNREILTRLERLFKEGAVAELSFLQQEQEVSNKKAAVDTLIEEIGVLRFQISQAETQVDRTDSSAQVDLYNRIEVNEQRISDIESQLGQRIIDNNRQIAQLNSELIQLEQNKSQQNLIAPITGTVFDLKANQPGYVANSTEPMMQIVPQDALVARIFIPNKDIGFVEVGQKVDVRIDAFSYSEFGDMEGTVTSIGTDALPPDELYPFYRFPADIELDTQELMSDGVPLELRSGMSLSANIKLRKRRIITFFTDIFVRKTDALKSGS